MKRVVINIIICVFLMLFALMFYKCITKGSDGVEVSRNPNGEYYFSSYGSRIWINRSFREGSLSGRYRGGGPHAGK